MTQFILFLFRLLLSLLSALVTFDYDIFLYPRGNSRTLSLSWKLALYVLFFFFFSWEAHNLPCENRRNLSRMGKEVSMFLAREIQSLMELKSTVRQRDLIWVETPQGEGGNFCALSRKEIVLVFFFFHFCQTSILSDVGYVGGNKINEIAVSLAVVRRVKSDLARIAVKWLFRLRFSVEVAGVWLYNVWMQCDLDVKTTIIVIFVLYTS